MKTLTLRMTTSEAMPDVECGDLDKPASGRICRHLLDTLDKHTSNEHYRCFTGSGADYLLLCPRCRHGDSELSLHWVCTTCFEDVAYGKRLGEKGHLEIREREIGFAFCQTSLKLTPTKLLQVAALNRREWIAIDENGDLLRIDGQKGMICREFSLRRLAPDLWKQPQSHILLAAEPLVLIAATYDTCGAVFDLRNGTMTMELCRGGYGVKLCRFPAAFFRSSGRLLLVHGVDWNRLDISDPFTGECLTGRELPGDRELDYFYGGLQVSPGGKWIASNGWVWHPMGVVRCWNLKQWLSSNCWESENGDSIRELCHRDSFWEGPMCWVSETTLAVWGLGDDKQLMTPGVRLFDVPSGRELGSFIGPQCAGDTGNFMYDEFLFSYSNFCEFGIWDVVTGERVYSSDSLTPLAYNRQNRTFLQQDEAGRLSLVRLNRPQQL